MIATRAWAARNLRLPPRTSRMTAEAMAMFADRAQREQRELIDFDSERGAGLSSFSEIPWPAGEEPRPRAAPPGHAGGPLPRADVLIVTWTMDEGHALSRVLTPGIDSRDDYRPYTHRYREYAAMMRPGCPALALTRLGMYWLTRIGDRSVLIFKSDSHMSQDGPRLPVARLWKQLISEVEPTLVITTGTARAIGKEFQVGDVVVSPVVRFDCRHQFARRPFRSASYASAPVNTTHFGEAAKLFAANAGELPRENRREPTIVTVRHHEVASAVVTADFFGFDTTDDRYHLQGLGAVSEMGDAVLGKVCAEIGRRAPRWVSVRNVSDPQIDAAGMSNREAGAVAAEIYREYGRWSSVCSAIVCWAVVRGER